MSSVDIITPAYNSAGTIARTLDSVLAQTRGDWTLWVIDDGSRDGTADVVRGYLGDPRVRLLSQPNRGAANARNLGLERAKCAGEYVAFLDSDDFWEPDFLARLIPALQGRPEAGLAWCDMALLGDSSGGTYRGDRIPIQGNAEETLEAIYRSVTFLPSSTLFRSKFFREGLRWSQECAPMEDMPIFFAVGCRSAIVHVEEILANYRVHTGSSTSSRGAIGRNYPAMIYTFRRLYRDYRRYISRSSYRWRMWFIYHQAADDRICAGRMAFPLLFRAILHRPLASVSWKILIQSILMRGKGRRTGVLA